LPLQTPPEVFGFHSNADITKDMNETNSLNNALLLCSPQEVGAAGSNFEDTLNSLIEQILLDFPLPFNIEECLHKYPVLYNESMNTVLT